MEPQLASHREVVEATAATETAMIPQVVPVNVYETSGAVVIVAPLPAVTPSDVVISLTGAALRIWARVRSAGPRQNLVHEWDYGGYERIVELPAGYGGRIEASLANGQLAVRVLRGQQSPDTVTVPLTSPDQTSS